jgi:aminoglycoside 6'-N-acetyltransferase
MPTQPTLRGERVVLRPATDDDLASLVAVIEQPGVAAWWGEGEAVRAWRRGDVEAARREMLDPEAPTFLVLVEGEMAGLIQYYEENEPDYRHAGMDIALHPDWHGRGLGPDALRTLARHLLDDRGHHRLIIDPRASNERAIATYRRVGFRPVGVMRRYERGADGKWHDGLLMDMLRDELT